MKRSFFYIFFIVNLLFFAQLPDIQAQKPRYFLADSLFQQQLWQSSFEEYQRQLRLYPESHPWVHVKMAYAAEKLSLWAESVYHLQQYYAYQPTDGVYDKLLHVAETHQMSGYGRDDLNFLYTLYLEYYPYVMAILLLFAIYLLWVFWQKKKQAQKVPIPYQALFFSYILLLIILTNTFSWLQFGIIRTPEALIRSNPSAGAETIGQIRQGDKINIVGSEDIWFHVYAQNQLGYIKKSDLWLIK